MPHPISSSRPVSRLARWLVTLCLLLLPAAARAGLADVRITEIFGDPAGAGAQWVELMNAGAEPIDLGGVWIGADNSGRAVPLAGLAPVPPAGFVVIHWSGPAAGPVSGSAGPEFATGSLPGLQTSAGSLILARSANLLDPASMLAFVQWGVADQRGADVADRLGLWPRGQFLPPVAPGHSHALAPGGSPRSADGWFEATTPTPGAPNTTPVSAWRGWRLVGEAAAAPAAVWDMQGDWLHVISVAASGTPLHYRFHAVAWEPGLPLQPSTRLPVALAGDGSGNLDLVLTDPGGGLWHRRWVEGRWGIPVSLGRGALLSPALAYNPTAKELALVTADPAGQLQLARFAGGVWSAWSPVGALVGPVAPSLAINPLDRPFDLVFVGPEGMVNDTHFAAGVWSPPLPAGMQTALRPAVAVTGADTVEVVITASDHKVYHNRLTDGVWAGWRWTGLESDAAPALLSSATSNGLELFAAGRDGRLMHCRLLNGVWGTPWPLGAVTGQPAAATPAPDGGLELLLAGADGKLWHNRFRPSSPELVSLSRQVQSIFDAHCVQCHDSGDPIAGQDLEPDSAFANVVHIPATELPGMRRVDPGKPDQSYLVHKISGTQKQVGGKGARMPLGGRLSDAEIHTIRDWITQGALDN